MQASAIALAEPDVPTELLQQLRRLHDEGRIMLRLDYARLTHMDSPVGVEADSNIWVYGLVAAALLALWLGGWKPAVAVAVIGTIGYFTLGKRYIHRRLLKRIEARALAETVLWRKLWRFGGVTLVSASGKSATAPKDDWMGFVTGEGDAPSPSSA